MKKIIISILAVIILLPLVLAGTITQNTPSTANPNSNFYLNLEVSNVPSTWGAILVENLTGSCTFSDGSKQYKNVLLYTSGTTLSVDVNTGGSGSCTVFGYYQFTDDAKKDLNSQTITISQTSNCTPQCTNKQCGNDACGGSCGTCASGLMCSSNQCISGNNNETPEGFCLGFANDWLSPYTHAGCQTNSILLIVGILIIVILLIALLK